jgi:hypothetical protein
MNPVESNIELVSIPNQLAPYLGSVPSGAILLAMLVVSLVLIFAGRTVVKVIAFLVVGVIGASVGGTLVSQFAAGMGSLGVLLGLVVGFILGGVVGLLLVTVGIGLAVGYAAYLLTTSFISGTTVPLIVGVVFFIIGVAFYDKILGVVTALAGGFLLFDVLVIFGIGAIPSTVIAVVLTIAGIWIQEGSRRRVSQPAVSTSPS